MHNNMQAVKEIHKKKNHSSGLEDMIQLENLKLVIHIG